MEGLDLIGVRARAVPADAHHPPDAYGSPEIEKCGAQPGRLRHDREAEGPPGPGAGGDEPARRRRPLDERRAAPLPDPAVCQRRGSALASPSTTAGQELGAVRDPADPEDVHGAPDTARRDAEAELASTASRLARRDRQRSRHPLDDRHRRPRDALRGRRPCRPGAAAGRGRGPPRPRGRTPTSRPGRPHVGARAGRRSLQHADRGPRPHARRALLPASATTRARSWAPPASRWTSPRARARSARRSSARLMLSAALQQAADLIFITDREGRLVYVNPAFERHTGYARAELLGQTPRILKSGQEPPEQYERMWETVLAGGVFERRGRQPRRSTARILRTEVHRPDPRRCRAASRTSSRSAATSRAQAGRGGAAAPAGADASGRRRSGGRPSTRWSHPCCWSTTGAA